MRVVLVGSILERARLRAALTKASLDVVGEAPTLAAAREIDADAFLVGSNGRDPAESPDVTGRGDRADLIDAGETADSVDSIDSIRSIDSVDSVDSVDSIDSIDSIYREPLTRREIEVLDLLAEGLPNKAIAARLGISDQTVKFHVSSICGKLGAANRTDAVRRAVRRGIISL